MVLESWPFMNPDLEKLIRLQRAETDLLKLEGELSEVPRLKAGIENGLNEARGRRDAAKSALDQSQKARRQQEAELQDLEGKRSKYKGQLMEVKTNKEYTAMLHEIEGVEKDIRAREDQILFEMERAEGLAAEVKRADAAFKTDEERYKGESRSLDERRLALEAQVAALRAERDAIAETVPEDTLGLFNRVAKLRGIAVAEAKDEMCQLCHVKLRLQMYVDLRRNEQITQCPSCSRILYYEPSAPVVVPQP